MFLFSIVYILLFLCLFIVSRHDKYNTIYFFKRTHFLSFFSSRPHPPTQLIVFPSVCWNFPSRSGGGNLTMSDLDLVGQIPSPCSQHCWEAMKVHTISSDSQTIHVLGHFFHFLQAHVTVKGRTGNLLEKLLLLET